MTITITTSNVNGIRAARRKGIAAWAGANTPDVWCMQEVRAPQEEIDPMPGLDEDVDSGRWIEADVRTPQGYVITVACVYVHAGNSDDEVKMTQKYRFLDTMLVRLGQLRDEAASGGRQAVLCGDFNIAHTPLDIKNAKANEKHAGFLPEERAYVDRWLSVRHAGTRADRVRIRHRQSPQL